MKSEIKKIITEVPLHCIASFVIGAYTILLINYFWFNNDITPPGVSAFVASIALLFTIYAAFKVKEWSEEKMNDKAFTQAEKIIDTLNQCYREFIIGSGFLLHLTDNTKTKTASPSHWLLVKYEKHKEKYQFETPIILNEVEILRMWKYKTQHEELFKSFVNNINEFDMMAATALEELNKHDSYATSRLQTHHQKLKKQKMEVITSYKNLTSLTFDNIFEPLETDKK